MNATNSSSVSHPPASPVKLGEPRAAGHTPGPWITDGVTVETEKPIVEGRPELGGTTIAFVQKPSDVQVELGLEEAKRVRNANAALIASAPTLHAENERLKEINAELVGLMQFVVSYHEWVATECLWHLEANAQPGLLAMIKDLRQALARSQSLNAQPNWQKGGRG